MTATVTPITRAAAAERVGKDERTLRRWVAAGELKPLAVAKDPATGKRVWWFDEPEVVRVDALMESRVGRRREARS